MPTANESERVPVAVLSAFQLACPAAIFGAAALGLPAVDLVLPLDIPYPVTQTIFTAFTGGRRVLFATIACTVLGVLQMVAIRDPIRGSARYTFGIALSVLGLATGLALAHGAFQVGFVPFLDELEMRPRIATYIALFGGVGFAALAIVRLMRFFDSPAAPTAVAAPDGPGPAA